jgi:hypothetical protein
MAIAVAIAVVIIIKNVFYSLDWLIDDDVFCFVEYVLSRHPQGGYAENCKQH